LPCGPAGDLLDDLSRLPPTADEKTAQQRKDLTDKFRERMKDKPPGLVAWAVIDAAANDLNLRPETLALLDRHLSDLVPPPVYAETVFLRRLADLRKIPARQRDWPFNAAAHALRAACAAERAVSSDPRGLDRVQKQLREATAKRREAEAILFGTSAQTDPAVKLLEEAQDGYRRAEEYAKALVDAWDTYEQALALLPGTAPLVTDAEGERAWLEAVRGVHRLEPLLIADPGPARDQLPSLARQLRELARQLRARTGKLSRPFAEANARSLAERSDRADARPSMVREIDRLLQAPCLRADDRERLWVAGRRLARRLHQKTVELDRRDDEGRCTEPPPSGGGADGSASERQRSERQRAMCRARLSIELATLAGLPRADEADLRGELDRASKGTDHATWDSLAPRLHQAWYQQLPRQAPLLKGGRADKKALRAADRLSRLLYPSDAGGRSTDPTLRLRQQESGDFRDWLARYYDAESQAVSECGGRPDFYLEAARKCRRGLR
jgi:hypothetical protein